MEVIERVQNEKQIKRHRLTVRNKVHCFFIVKTTGCYWLLLRRINNQNWLSVRILAALDVFSHSSFMHYLSYHNLVIKINMNI